jgi:hypothetical protein
VGEIQRPVDVVEKKLLGVLEIVDNHNLIHAHPARSASLENLLYVGVGDAIDLDIGGLP